jgi:hypothetical protein
MDDMKDAQIGFYKKTKNLHVEDQVSFEAQLLLPIKTLAYGVPPQPQNFQISKCYTRYCCHLFDVAIKKVYATPFLRLPTSEVVKSIVKLHKEVHHVNGFLGILDYSHLDSLEQV